MGSRGNGGGAGVGYNRSLQHAASSTQQSRKENPLAKSQERIYSAQQLVQALKSASAAVRDQLQVLAILDGTAMSWPGLQQAVDDLEFLVDMSGQTVGRLEKDHKDMEAGLRDAQAEVVTLKEAMALQNSGKEELQREVGQLNKELKALQGKLDAATKEVQQQKQELWALEKQRADLASETERVKQDNEFMEGEITTLRATVTEQMQQVTALKEELATRKADVAHLKQLSGDQKGQIEHLKRSLDSANGQLRETQQALNQTRSDKAHFEREADRLQEESSRLSTEFNKTSKELERLREWQEVLKKVEADKLREEQDGRLKDRLEAEAQRAAIEKALAAVQADAAHKQERLSAKTQEAENLAKHLNLAGVHSKDLQNKLAKLNAEKASMARQRDEAKAAAAKLQQALSNAERLAAQADKDHTVAVSQAREAAASEKATLQAAVEESRKEAAVQKALAEGWARDLREAQERIKEEQGKAAALQSRIDQILGARSLDNQDSTKIATAEGEIARLQGQLEAKETEIKRMRVEFTSERKRLEKQIEALQRECNESAQEIQRLRDGEGSRLPPLRGPITIQEELAHLKRMINSMPPAQDGSSSPARLPPVIAATAFNNSSGKGVMSARAHLTR